MISVYRWPQPEILEKLGSRPFQDSGLLQRVEEILRNVREKGDEALLQYVRDFDGCVLKPGRLKVTPEEIADAYKQVDTEFLTVIRQAKEKILNYHRQQKRANWFTQEPDGSVTGQLIFPLERVGLYVPGGTAKYPSSVLMTCLPAVVAGVPEIVMVTPPGPDGTIAPVILVAAGEAGVTEIYKAGGAQAIAALAYGTLSIRPVDKIVGPGNIYVTLAKKLVFGTVGIDMLAGPSEILIIGDGSVAPALAAADLLSQAEHDKRARALLVTPDESWAEQVAEEVKRQLLMLPRSPIAEEALRDNGAIIIVQDLEEAFTVANEVAPEHLELLLDGPWSYLAKVRHAGAVFLGPYSPEPLGDYWAGPSHVLPTGRAARYASPLGVDDFCRRSSLISYSREGLQKAAPSIRRLAGVEGLDAHGAAVVARFKEEYDEKAYR